LGDIDLVRKPPRHFIRRRTFEEQLERLAQVRPGFLHRFALAADVEFRAQGHEAVVFSLNDCGQLSRHGFSP
jgi:hypothetical protein